MPRCGKCSSKWASPASVASWLACACRAGKLSQGGVLGLFADVYIGYVLRLFVYMFKTLAGGLRARGSASWQLANACLSSPGLADRGFWACPTAEITYTYRYNGELYSDIYERPFLLLNSATEYALRFRVGD